MLKALEDSSTDYAIIGEVMKISNLYSSRIKRGSDHLANANLYSLLPKVDEY